MDQDTGQNVQIDATGTPQIVDPMSGMPMQSPDGQGASDLGSLMRGAGDALEIEPLSQFGQGGGEAEIEPAAVAPVPKLPPATFVAQEDGNTYEVDATGTIKPAGQSGMQPVQREGAMDPGMAARQQSDMYGAQQRSLASTEQARADEVRIYNEMTLKQMATNEAERLKQEALVQEEQSKVARWQQEQQDVNDMQVTTDLVSARGPIGAAFAVLGATLLGGTGSDAGLRMIDRTLEQHMRLVCCEKCKGAAPQTIEKQCLHQRHNIRQWRDSTNGTGLG